MIFAKVRSVLTKVTDTQTGAHIHTETDKPIAIGEILQICLKMKGAILFFVTTELHTNFEKKIIKSIIKSGRPPVLDLCLT